MVLDVPKSSWTVPGSVEIDDDSTLLHPIQFKLWVEGVKRSQLKYFLAFRTGKFDANFCFDLSELSYVLKHLSRT
jgi:hypothetical protein